MGTASFDFSGETVIVTGGSSGIGREIACRFGDAGATVLNVDVRPEPKDVDDNVPTHEVIRSAGSQAEYVEADVSDPEQLQSIIEAAHEFGGVDVLVNNAGVQIGGEFTEITPEEFDTVHDVNVRGTFFGMQAAGKDMIERQVDGSIINIASISSSEVQKQNAIYESSKAAVKMLTRSAAFAFSDYGIRVNAVAPGHTATEFLSGLTEKQYEKARNDEFLKPIPLARPAEPRDVADTVLFLATDSSGYVTGETVHVDGGWQIL